MVGINVVQEQYHAALRFVALSHNRSQAVVICRVQAHMTWLIVYDQVWSDTDNCWQ